MSYIISVMGGAFLGLLFASLFVAANTKDKPPEKNIPQTIEELRSLCSMNESKTAHIWIADKFGVFPSLAGFVSNCFNNGVHIEAAYSLEESEYFKEADYGKTWLAFRRRQTAEDWFQKAENFRTE